MNFTNMLSACINNVSIFTLSKRFKCEAMNIHSIYTYMCITGLMIYLYIYGALI